MDLDGYKELLWKKFPQTDTILLRKNGKKDLEYVYEWGVYEREKNRRGLFLNYSFVRL